MLTLLFALAGVAVLVGAFIAVKRAHDRNIAEQNTLIGFYARSQDISRVSYAHERSANRYDADQKSARLEGHLNTMIVNNKKLDHDAKNRSLNLLETLQKDTKGSSSSRFHGAALGILALLSTGNIEGAENLVRTFDDDADRVVSFVDQLVSSADDSAEVLRFLETALRLRTDPENAHLCDIADEITLEMSRNKDDEDDVDALDIVSTDTAKVPS